MNIIDLNIDDEYSYTQILSAFKLDKLFGIGVSKQTQSIVLVYSENGAYNNRWDSNHEILTYIGTGQTGDQSLSTPENAAIRNSRESGLDIHIFNKSYAKRYKYEGLFDLQGEPADELDKVKDRYVLAFQLKPQQALGYSLGATEKVTEQDTSDGIDDSWSRESAAVKELLRNKVDLNKEQSEAVAEINSDVLLAARAGSGKTRVATAKTYYLIQHQNIDREKVMLLAFNREAAKEVRSRLNDTGNGCFGLGNFGGASTFHSLAYHIIQNDISVDSILSDDGEPKRFKLIQKLVKYQVEHDIKFRKCVYSLLREEMEEFDEATGPLSKSGYDNLRSVAKITLDGKYVKSRGEKYIGDFLFEHGINYRYEKGWPYDDGDWDVKKHNDIYRPDFSINLNSDSEEIDHVIEHWGIYENDPEERVADSFTKTYKEYSQQIKDKRQYWRVRSTKGINPSVNLLETSMADLDETREDFERALKQRIESTGNKVEKLPEEELLERAITIQEPRIVSMFMGYINKALSKRLSATDLDLMISKLAKSNGKQDVKYIVEYSLLANKIYQQYIDRLDKENKIDYYGLLELAIKKVNKSKGDCSIVRKEHDYAINLSDLEYLLIDEYQDFSPLFYDLVGSIRKHNTSLKLFCVGDDWQAINSFAGSNLDYFLKFQEYFKDSKKMHLLTNYRSNANIVNLSNNLIPEEWGKPSVPYKEDVGYDIKSILLNDVFVDMNDPWMRKVSKEPLSKRRQQLIALCRKQISEHPDNSILILRRTHRGENKHNSLDTLIEQLKRACIGVRDSSDFVTRDGNIRANHFVEVSTFHSSKGREADIVIILDVAPLVHPDVQLNLVFDNNCFNHAQDEERRLFYVALTRAKERLIFAINPNKGQDYMYDLNLEGSVIKQ